MKGRLFSYYVVMLASRIFFGAYALLFVVCGIAPLDRAVWWAENLPMFLIIASVAWIGRSHAFTTMSYTMMFFLLALHTIGGHYTFAEVPFDWVTDTFGFDRNHYDRIAHFSVGFYAFPIAEILHRKKMVNRSWILYAFPIFSIMTVAGAYEVFEWQYAILGDPDAGIAVLGSQGDIWDAQKDILADTLGACFAMLTFAWIHRRTATSC
jgi:putative membrane protein